MEKTTTFNCPKIVFSKFHLPNYDTNFSKFCNIFFDGKNASGHLGPEKKEWPVAVVAYFCYIICEVSTS